MESSGVRLPRTPQQCSPTRQCAPVPRPNQPGPALAPMPPPRKTGHAHDPAHSFRMHPVFQSALPNQSPIDLEHPVRPRPAKASSSPINANSALVWAPVSHNSHPTVCRARGHKRYLAVGGATRNQFGPAVNRNPEKNKGMKPSTMTAACVSVGGTVLPRPSPPVTRSICTANHQKLAAMRMSMASAKPRRWGAAMSVEKRQGPRTGSGLALRAAAAVLGCKEIVRGPWGRSCSVRAVMKGLYSLHETSSLTGVKNAYGEHPSTGYLRADAPSPQTPSNWRASSRLSRSCQ